MQSLDVFFKVTEIISFLCAGILIYGKLTEKVTKMQGRIDEIQRNRDKDDRLDDRTQNKLDELSERIASMEGQLQRKQERP